MASSLFRDDNAKTLAHPAGLRPAGLAANISSCTLSSSVQELAMPAAASTANGSSIVRVCAGAQGAFYAFDAAGQSASYTGLTNMIMLPANAVEYVKVSKQDAKVYVLQLGTAGSFQIAAMG